MSKEKVISIYDNSSKIIKIGENLAQKYQKIHLNGLIGSSMSFVINSLFKKVETSFLLMLNDKEEAAYYLNDLEQMIGQDDVLFYPSSYRRPYQIEETDNANVLLRAEVLNRINSRKNQPLL